jgi:hypothetical protein
VRVGVLLALALALALPGGAAGSPYVRSGIQDDAWIRYGPGTLDQRLDRLQDLGLDLVRLNVHWNEVSPKRGTFDWSAYDPVIRGLNARGIELLLMLMSTPAWANGGRDAFWAPASGSTFAAFARNTAQRYPFVRRFAIWNEPNQRRWLQPTTPQVYVKRLLNPAYAAIKGVRKGALVAGGVTAPRASVGGVSPVAWIQGMSKAGARLDAYAHNPHPLSPAETPTSGGCAHCETITMADLPRLLSTVRRAFGPKRIWLTEYGYQTNPPDRLLGVSWTAQARFMSEAALRAFLAPRVDVHVQFLVRDEPDLARWQSGLFTTSGVRKPAYASFLTPFAVRSRTGLRTTVWGQVRPGTGPQRYRIERFANGGWRPVGATARTTKAGYFTRVVRAGPDARLRVVHLPSRTASAVLVVR